jgi:hypothetical protein
VISELGVLHRKNTFVISQEVPETRKNPNLGGCVVMPEGMFTQYTIHRVELAIDEAEAVFEELGSFLIRQRKIKKKVKEAALNARLDKLKAETSAVERELDALGRARKPSQKSAKN